MEKLKKEIIEYSKEIGINKIGFTTADPFLILKERLKQQKELQYDSGFEEEDIEKRTNPKLLLPNAASIISIALAYPSKLPNPPKSIKNDPRGLFCRASWGEDYHTVLKRKLALLEEFILKRVPEAKVKSMVDTGELSDRAVAERAGIGWSGKNCSILTEEFGSYIYLGEMITTIYFEPDMPIEDLCGSCRKCIDACPTGALVGPGQINAKTCIAYLTQTKTTIPKELIDKIGNRLYGCDSCQTSCPYNKGMNHHFHEEMEPIGEVVKPKLKPILQLSNRSFKETYGHLSGAWRGKNPIQRNAIIGLAHFKDKSAIPLLISLLQKDSRPMIRETVAWAIGEIGDKDLISELEKQLQHEAEETVQSEIETAIKKLKE